MQLADMTAEQRIEKWGYDPLAGLKYIGRTEKEFNYHHPSLPGAKGRFEFYFNPETGAIDVNHFGCNGRIFTGEQLKDGTIVFRPPWGYPFADIFVEEFKNLRDKFLTTLQNQHPS